MKPGNRRDAQGANSSSGVQPLADKADRYDYVLNAGLFEQTGVFMRKRRSCLRR